MFSFSINIQSLQIVAQLKFFFCLLKVTASCGAPRGSGPYCAQLIFARGQFGETNSWCDYGHHKNALLFS